MIWKKETTSKTIEFNDESGGSECYSNMFKWNASLSFKSIEDEYFMPVDKNSIDF